MRRFLASKNRVIKFLFALGIFLLLAQLLLSASYDIGRIQIGYSNNTRRLLRQVSFIYNITNTNLSFPASYGSEHGASLSNNGFQVAQNGDRSTHTGEHHEGHDGFALAASVREKCKNVTAKSLGRFYSIQGSVVKRLLYCPMEKVGTTFWRRVLYMLTASDGGKYTDPYDVPISKALGARKFYTVPSNIVAKSFLQSNSFSFLVVRNPFSRLLSAFVDKLVPPNPYYWKVFGSRAITTYRKNADARSKTYGHDVTFPEFVKHVTESERTKRNLDPHYISTFSSCKPCDTHYNYIGKMESFKTDALFILDKVGLNSTVEFLAKGDKFKELTTDDAITDSIYSPFSWRTQIVKIISWEKALRRVWLKLQMRGIVAYTERFDSYVTAREIENNITSKQFIDKARQANTNSKPDDLKQQKIEVMKEAFMMLHFDDLMAFRNTYANDFQLYGYDESPPLLFDRPKEPQAPTKYFNYNHLN